MRVELSVELTSKEDKLDFYLTKKLEMDALPDVGEQIGEELSEDDDKALFFKVENRLFYLGKYVHIMLEPLFRINNENKNDILRRMNEFGWTY